MHRCPYDLLKLFKLTEKNHLYKVQKGALLMQVSCFVFRNVHVSRDCTLLSLGKSLRLGVLHCVYSSFYSICEVILFGAVKCHVKIKT